MNHLSFRRLFLVLTTVVILLTGCLGLHAEEATTHAPTAETRLRGFSSGNISMQTLQDAKQQWNANSIRFHPNLSLEAQRAGKTKKQYWPEYLKELKQGLDDAKKLNMAVIITMPALGLYDPDPQLDRKEKWTRFWDNEANLADLIQCWKDIATLAKDRNQIIWFDILNEPVDWRAMPSFAPKWPSWAQQIIDAIRTIDKTHPVVVEVGPGGLVWGFKDFPALRDDNIIYSIHQYKPQAYTHQGIADIDKTDLMSAYLKTQRRWPGIYAEDGVGLWNKDRIEKELSPVYEFLKRNPGARIYVGEFSVVRWAPDGAQYLQDNIDIFEKNGWDWSYHAFREWSGWSLENSDKYTNGPDPMPNGQLTERAKVMKKALKKNGELQ